MKTMRYVFMTVLVMLANTMHVYAGNFPNTGDNSGIWYYVGAAAASLVIILILLILYFRKSDKKK